MHYTEQAVKRLPSIWRRGSKWGYRSKVATPCKYTYNL